MMEKRLSLAVMIIQYAFGIQKLGYQLVIFWKGIITVFRVLPFLLMDRKLHLEAKILQYVSGIQKLGYKLAILWKAIAIMLSV